MGKTCRIRFYAELNDFLPKNKKHRSFNHELFGSPAVKDLIESLGIPHTEVDLVLINGVPVQFTQQVRSGDRISVFPIFKSVDNSEVTKVRPSPLRKMRFVLDVHLGRLTALLRMLGFDCIFSCDLSDEEIIEIAEREKRIILTHDRELLKRNRVTHGYCVRSTEKTEQTVEILRRFDLFESIAPFSRCMSCNGVLKNIAKRDVEEYLPEKVKEKHTEFRRCELCGKVFWKGTHYERMVKFISEIISEISDIEIRNIFFQ